MSITLFKKASRLLLITQLFSTVSFAVLYSTLVLFMTQALGFTVTKASAVMGVFVAFNYGLHILGGYIGGRLISYRVLFLLGMVLQIFACLFLAFPSTEHLYIALALFLTGCGLNVPCINMMLTQQFENNDGDRESAFFWNYAGMNIGFFIGFTIAGIYQGKQSYNSLFLITTITNIIAFLLLATSWKTVADRTTPLVKKIQQKGNNILLKNNFFALLIIFITVLLLFIALQYPLNTNYIALVVGILLLLMFIPIARAQNIKEQKDKVYAYVILATFGLVFWSAYQLAPMALTVFAEANIDKHLLGFTIQTQWFQNVNTVVIAVGGMLLPSILLIIRKRFIFSFPMQFCFSLIFIAIGFAMLIIGILCANSYGYTAAIWLILSYVFQSIGELLIGPTGYAMVGKLAKPKLQGLMMGSWMVVTGSTSGVIASLLSILVASPDINAAPIETNSSYLTLFTGLTIVAAVAAFIMYLIIPKIRKLAYI
ncbi:peptide MFS transporter [Francisella sp. TX07-6608]|uniref:peptide MFS transporter n=1 Tax=Francisella sp. TX07-6608 TaxID=573568 RepID=UPI0008F9A57A|nr:oligopeptide:H+ symporter [Francisella sp. TX07-6608]OIN83750.1 amino acid/peptide transporter family protein [Francisella sp. TX07-6608]